MASGKTDTYENSIISHFMSAGAVATTSAYIALYSVAPGETGGGTELAVANNYARIAVGLGAPVAGVASNAAEVLFTATGGVWLGIVGHSICNASTLGDILMYEDAVAGPTLANGDSYRFDAGDIVVTET